MDINLTDTNTRILQFLETAEYIKAEKLSSWYLSEKDPNAFEPKFYLGVALQFQGKVKNALEIFRKAQLLRPENINVMQAIASCLEQLNRYDESYDQLMRAFDIDPQNANLLANIGAILERLKKSNEALNYYDIALNIHPKNYTALLNRGSLLANLGLRNEWLKHCKNAYIEYPQSIAILYNLVDALLGMFKYDEALTLCDSGLALQPNHANLLFKKGLILSCLRSFELAKKCLAEAQLIDSKVIENILPYTSNLDINVEISLNPITLYLDAMYSAQKLCFWQYRHEYMEEWKNLILCPKTHHYVVNNLEFGFQIISLNLNGSIRLQLGKNMSDWIQDMVWLEGMPPFKFKNKNHKKLNIGYISADFRIHPVGLLTKQIYGLHDKCEFNIYAYSIFDTTEKDYIRLSIEKDCNTFRSVTNLSDVEIARLIYKDEIDILIDLTGNSTFGRPKIMAMRPAPIQIAYLGYPGTSGADYIDYAIVDNVIGHNQKHWSEALVTMPNAFSPYDNQTNNSATNKTKQDYCLPENGIVFCCFNNNYKIEPQVFGSWMRILRAVPNSVLWLVVEHGEVESRLKDAAKQQQIDPERLIFAPFVPYDEHIIRYQLADLFLDTYWHNAHTTAADALWQGLPVITCAGDVISSRLAASLLNALEMPELITTDYDEYEALAIHYGTNDDARNAMRAKLKNKRYTAPLFDTARTTKSLECAYKMVWQRYCKGLPAISMQVIEIENQQLD